MSEQDNAPNHLACPKCKSTDLAFTGLKDNMRAQEEGGESVSGTYSWKCKKCNHDFEITVLRQKPDDPRP